MRFHVEGMTCNHCVHAVTRAIHALDADARVEVDLRAGTVVVEGGIDAGLALAAIEAEGYRVLGAPQRASA